MSDNDLIESVIRYRKKRELLKGKYRAKLESDLESELIDVGREVASLKAQGRTVDAITALMGTKNRTFLYAALEAFQQQGEAPEKPALTVPNAPIELYDYKIHKDGEFWNVTVGSEEYTLLNADDVPHEWLDETDPERKAMYKVILRQIGE